MLIVIQESLLLFCWFRKWLVYPIIKRSGKASPSSSSVEIKTKDSPSPTTPNKLSQGSVPYQIQFLTNEVENKQNSYKLAEKKEELTNYTKILTVETTVPKVSFSNESANIQREKSKERTKKSEIHENSEKASEENKNACTSSLYLTIRKPIARRITEEHESSPEIENESKPKKLKAPTQEEKSYNEKYSKTTKDKDQSQSEIIFNDIKLRCTDVQRITLFEVIFFIILKLSHIDTVYEGLKSEPKNQNKLVLIDKS